MVQVQFWLIDMVAFTETLILRHTATGLMHWALIDSVLRNASKI